MLNDKRNFTFYHGDITNPSEVLDCMERYDIDTIFHFAAQSHVDLSFGNSYGFTHTNVYGTHVVLESAKKIGVNRFVHISTDEVYGEVKDDEDDLLETSILAPTNPYAASKAAAEMLVNSYMKSFKLPVIIVRSNNVYGPHQFPESKSHSLLFSFLFLPPFPPCLISSYPNLIALTSIRNNTKVHVPVEPPETDGHPRGREPDQALLVRRGCRRCLRHYPPQGSARPDLQRRLERRDI
jgi:nucleoside-diphosphate-sugar epimerase